MRYTTWLPQSPGDATIRWDRVRELREAIQQGRYRIASVDLADKLIQTLRDSTLHSRPC